MKEDIEVVDTSKMKFPTKEEINKLHETAEKYFTLIYGIVKSSINSTEKINVYEHYFPNPEVFGIVMGKIAHEYADNDDIEICYAKPEDKEKNVFIRFTVSNLALIKANKILKDEHKMAMNSLSKDVRENIVNVVYEKNNKKDE